MSKKHLPLLLIVLACLVFRCSPTKCRLKGRWEKRVIARYQKCLDKGFQSSLGGCKVHSGRLSRYRTRRCRRMETKLKNCDYTCSNPSPSPTPNPNPPTPNTEVTIKISPENLQEEESGTAVFTCTATVPKPDKIYWDRFALDSNSYQGIAGQTKLQASERLTRKDGGWEVKSVLKVAPLDYNDGGSYRCSLKDYPAIAQAVLKVQKKAPAYALKISPENERKQESQTATFTCTATVPTPAKIYWHRFVLTSKGYDDITSLAKEEVQHAKNGSGWQIKSVLKVGQLKFADGGQYRCMLKDYPTSAEASLLVQHESSPNGNIPPPPFPIPGEEAM